MQRWRDLPPLAPLRKNSPSGASSKGWSALSGTQKRLLLLLRVIAPPATNCHTAADELAERRVNHEAGVTEEEEQGSK